ncbi:MAG: hypothetical protein ACRD2W_17800, partial [Acidimicrobiales bacterium]
MSASSDDDGPFQGVHGEDALRETISVLRGEIEALQRLEPLFVEGTAVLRVEIQSLRSQLAELPAGGGTGAGVAELPGLRAELRDTLREATEHLRTLVVEEVNELRGELQGVRAGLNDRRSQDRADLQTSLAAGSDNLRAALAEDAAGVRAELEAVRAQLKEQQVADQHVLRVELRAALREWNEHLRTRIVEEATELRSELHQVRGHLTDQQAQHRSDLKATVGEGSNQLLTAVTEATAALRTEVAFLADQMPTREMVTAAIAQQEQLRAVLRGEVESLRAELRAMPAQIEEQRTASAVDTRAAVREGGQAVEGAFAQHAERLVGEMQGLLAQHEARHGDEGQQLRAIVAAGVDNLRAALLAETASARTSLVEHSERLRTEIQAVWAQLNDQHAEERAELGRALADSTDYVRSALRREVEAIGMGLTATQAAAHDELASLRGRVEAFSALFSTGQAATRADLNELHDLVQAATAALAAGQQDSGGVRMQLDALGMDLTTAQATAREQAVALSARLDEVADSLRESLDQDGAGLSARLDEVEGSLRARLDEVAANNLEPVRAQLEALATELAASHGAGQDELRAAVLEHGKRVRAAVDEHAAATRDALLERSEELRAEVQAVWSQLNDQHAAERLQLDDTMRETGERLRASLLVELAESIQDQVDTLARTSAASFAEQVDGLRAALEDPERQDHRERLVREATATAERLTSLQGELKTWRQQAGDERTGEVGALLAAVAGNEERLHQLMTAFLAEADRRRHEDRDELQAAFAAAAEERQAQLAYLEAALQTFNQALALERQEMQALVRWSQEATDASVAEVSGRLDALGSMLSRIMAGEGVLEVSEAVAALRTDVARISRKLPAKAKTAPGDDTHTAKRAPRTAPAARARR